MVGIQGWRCRIQVCLPQLVAPRYVELQDWHTHATIYWNGAAIGSDRRFYIPEALVRAENILVIAVNGYHHPAQCGEVRVGTYYQAISLQLQVGAGKATASGTSG